MLARLRATVNQRYARAIALLSIAMFSPSTALAQAAPGGGCGSSNGFDLGKMTDTLAYIGNIVSGTMARWIIIIAVVMTVVFLMFSGDNVSGIVKTVVGIIVGVVFIFALIAWLGGFGSTNCS